MLVENFDDWVGNEVKSYDTIDSHRMSGLRAALDYKDSKLKKGAELPPCWQWIFCTETVAQSNLGSDGHPVKGTFLPHISLPRRMWAGSRLTFHSPLTLCDQVCKRSKVVSITSKVGKSGELVFVLLSHKWFVGERMVIEEEQDIVFREAPSKDGPPTIKTNQSPAIPSKWTREIVPDSVLLFRYSALTFNSHRIHYDQRYCVQEEGYPGLVVHGPLIATLMVDSFQRNNPDSTITKFSFRAISPLFEGQKFYLKGNFRTEKGAADVWAETLDGNYASQGIILFK